MFLVGLRGLQSGANQYENPVDIFKESGEGTILCTSDPNNNKTICSGDIKLLMTP